MTDATDGPLVELVPAALDPAGTYHAQQAAHLLAVRAALARAHATGWVVAPAAPDRAVDARTGANLMAADPAHWTDREHWTCPRCHRGRCVPRGTAPDRAACDGPICGGAALVMEGPCSEPDYYDPPQAVLEVADG
jgi:hypothetical protein